MTDSSSYPHQLSEAARVYPDSCNAYGSFSAAGDYIALRLQAPEIMMQFGSGEVDFGEDPKGRLFYQSDITWPTACDSIYTIFYYESPTSVTVVVRADFYVIDTAGDPTPFARFLANVQGSQLPQIVPGLGQGKWAQLEAATCHVQATRMSGNAQLNLGSNAILKQVYFKTQAMDRISESGTMFFSNISRLKSQPDDMNRCVADYAAGRIVFHVENEPEDIVALFVPNKPMAIGPPGIQKVTWKDFGERHG